MHSHAPCFLDHVLWKLFYFSLVLYSYIPSFSTVIANNSIGTCSNFYHSGPDEPLSNFEPEPTTQMKGSSSQDFSDLEGTKESTSLTTQG